MSDIFPENVNIYQKKNEGKYPKNKFNVSNETVYCNQLNLNLNCVLL